MEKLYDLTDREVAAVLAGLRLLQNETELETTGCSDGLPDGIHDILGADPLTTHEIDALCEYLNTGG